VHKHKDTDKDWRECAALTSISPHPIHRFGAAANLSLPVRLVNWQDAQLRGYVSARSDPLGNDWGNLLEKSRAQSRDLKRMVRPERFELPTFWFVVSSGTETPTP